MLDELQYYLGAVKSGAKKMIIPTKMEGYLGTHVCFNCTFMYVPESVARLAHFKVRVYDGNYTYSNYLSMYSEAYKREIAFLKSLKCFFLSVFCLFYFVINNLVMNCITFFHQYIDERIHFPYNSLLFHSYLDHTINYAICDYYVLLFLTGKSTPSANIFIEITYYCTPSQLILKLN